MRRSARPAGGGEERPAGGEASAGAERGYVPALGLHALTALYDPLIRWGLREAAFKRRLLGQADLRPGQRVLDLGCGTGTLLVMARAAEPRLALTGLDGDGAVLARARAKLRAGPRPGLVRGLSFALPFADGAFDRVLSSLFFHHLTRDEKRRTLTEARRVLAPGGELHVADWGPQRGPVRVVFQVVRHLDGADRVDDNARGLIPELIRDAGFEDVGEVGRVATALGSISFWSALRPRESSGSPLT